MIKQICPLTGNFIDPAIKKTVRGHFIFNGIIPLQYAPKEGKHRDT